MGKDKWTLQGTLDLLIWKTQTWANAWVWYFGVIGKYRRTF
jgi:hypothetical protein